MSERTNKELLHSLEGPSGADPSVDLALDPGAAQLIGLRLAERVRAFSPQSVLTWADENDTVLGHIVAETLGLPRSVITLDLGLLSLSGAPTADRVVLLSVQFDGDHPIAPVSTLLDREGKQLVAALGLLQPESGLSAPDGIVVESLE